VLNKVYRPALGLLLLSLAFFQIDFGQLRSAILSTNFIWFFLALFLALLANFCCATRWQGIVLSYQLPMGWVQSVKLYFQGVMANTVLPGGIIGGDLWRLFGLIQLGAAKLTAAETVFFDRVSGLWSLTWISLAASMFGLVGDIGESQREIAIIYFVALLCTAIGPLLFFRVTAVRIPMLLSVAPISVFSQLLTVSSFLCCALASGVDASYLSIAAICVGVFIAAALPASVGGFGSREIASIFFLGSLGASAETAFLCSVLFGLTATVQGLTFMVFFGLTDRATLRPPKMPSA